MESIRYCEYPVLQMQVGYTSQQSRRHAAKNEGEQVMRSNHNMCRLPAGLRTMAIALALVMGLHGLAPSSYGSLIQSAPVSMENARAADLATVQQMLELKVVQHRLEALGFTQNEIDLRLAMASDADLHQLATQSEDLLAGGAAGLLVTVLVVILLVFLILRITAVDTTDTSGMLVA